MSMPRSFMLKYNDAGNENNPVLSMKNKHDIE